MPAKQISPSIELAADVLSEASHTDDEASSILTQLPPFPPSTRTASSGSRDVFSQRLFTLYKPLLPRKLDNEKNPAASCIAAVAGIAFADADASSSTNDTLAASLEGNPSSNASFSVSFVSSVSLAAAAEGKYRTEEDDDATKPRLQPLQNQVEERPNRQRVEYAQKAHMMMRKRFLKKRFARPQHHQPRGSLTSSLTSTTTTSAAAAVVAATGYSATTNDDCHDTTRKTVNEDCTKDCENNESNVVVVAAARTINVDQANVKDENSNNKKNIDNRIVQETNSFLLQTGDKNVRTSDDPSVFTFTNGSVNVSGNAETGPSAWSARVNRTLEDYSSYVLHTTQDKTTSVLLDTRSKRSSAQSPNR
jgi:hypothetical protein